MNKKGQILIITIYKDIWILKMVKYNSDQFWEKIVFSTGGPLIVPFYVPAKIGCNAKQYYERPTILCHL